MKQLNTLKTLVMLTLVLLAFLSFNGSTYAARTISFENMKLSLSEIDCENLGIIVWDQREQIISQSQPETMLGYIRSTVGIAWPCFIKNDQTLSSLLLEKIQQAYNEYGIQINPIQSSSSDTTEHLMEKIKSYEYDKVLVIKVNKLQFDGYWNIEFVADIEMQLYNTNGDLLYSNKYEQKIPMGKASKYKKTAPVTLKEIFDGALNEPETIDAINNG